MGRSVPVTLVSMLFAVTASQAWARGGGEGHGAGSMGGHNINAATPAVPASNTGSRAIPAMPGNPKAEEEVSEHRRDNASGNADTGDSVGRHHSKSHHNKGHKHPHNDTTNSGESSGH